MVAIAVDLHAARASGGRVLHLFSDAGELTRPLCGFIGRRWHHPGNAVPPWVRDAFGRGEEKTAIEWIHNRDGLITAGIRWSYCRACCRRLRGPS